LTACKNSTLATYPQLKFGRENRREGTGGEEGEEMDKEGKEIGKGRRGR